MHLLVLAEDMPSAAKRARVEADALEDGVDGAAAGNTPPTADHAPSLQHAAVEDAPHHSAMPGTPAYGGIDTWLPEPDQPVVSVPPVPATASVPALLQGQAPQMEGEWQQTGMQTGTMAAA